LKQDYETPALIVYEDLSDVTTGGLSTSPV